MTSDGAAARSRYLLDGRRVRITDLLAAGILEPDTKLEFARPRSGDVYHATVTRNGRIQLKNGRIYNSPSRAAIAAVGYGSFDGWYAWRITETNQLLADARALLLDRAAAESAAAASPDGDDSRASQRHALLKEARARAEVGVPLRLTVRELVSHWGADSRHELVSERIRTDLENHGLTTSPYFEKVALETPVQLITVSVADALPDEATDNAATTTTAAEQGTAAPQHDEVGLTLAHLPSANNGIKGIHPQATIDEAITAMLLDDFSQLPVMQRENDRAVRYAVTWQSIARAWHLDRKATLSDAFVDVVVSAYDTELVDVLDVLQDREFILVRDATNIVVGIVTTADVVEAYGQLATPFFLVGELDRMLRRVVSDSFTLDQVNQTCSRPGPGRHETTDTLTFGDYQSILSNGGNWDSLGWPLDRKLSTARLDELRRVRNDIMHFNPDSVPDGSVAMIRNMIHVLRKYG